MIVRIEFDTESTDDDEGGLLGTVFTAVSSYYEGSSRQAAKKAHPSNVSGVSTIGVVKNGPIGLVVNNETKDEEDEEVAETPETPAEPEMVKADDPEPADDDDEPAYTLKDALTLAARRLHADSAGGRKVVSDALKAVGAHRVSEVTPDKADEFIAGLGFTVKEIKKILVDEA